VCAIAGKLDQTIGRMLVGPSVSYSRGRGRTPFEGRPVYVTTKVDKRVPHSAAHPCVEREGRVGAGNRPPVCARAVGLGRAWKSPPRGDDADCTFRPQAKEGSFEVEAGIVFLRSPLRSLR